MRRRVGSGLIVLGGLSVLAALVQDLDFGWWLGIGIGGLAALAGLALLAPSAGRSKGWLIQVEGFVLVGFLALAIHLARFEITEVKAALGGIESPLSRGDPRALIVEQSTYRGALLDRNGVVLARSVSAGGVMRREYPMGRWGSLVGYYSPRVVGKGGLELSLDAYLSGRRGGGLIGGIYRALGRPGPGNDVWITVDSKLQQRADTLLAGRRGAVVLLDARTSAILVASSGPDFSPAELSDDFSVPQGVDARRVLENWGKLSARADSPLLNRALQGLYPPGSVFKTVTLAAALRSGKLALDSVFTDTGSLNVQGHIILDPNRPDPARITYTLGEGYIWSLNSVFAQASLILGPSWLESTAEAFGFGTAPLDDFPASVSRLYRDPGFLLQEPGLADTGFGQGQILASPLQMALVAGAVANEGEMPVPHLLDRVATPDGQVTYQYTPGMKAVLDPQVARQVKSAMVQAVRSGWAKAAGLPGVTVAGKTGTAENPQGPPHAWFVGFAPAERPLYVVAVVIENGGEGASVALPVGREMLRAALETK